MGTRPDPAWQIPNKLNMILLFSACGCALFCLWLGNQYSDRPEILIPLGIGYSYLMLTNYALMHEAAHAKLHTNSRLNYLLGMLSGFFFFSVAPLPVFSFVIVTTSSFFLEDCNQEITNVTKTTKSATRTTTSIREWCSRKSDSNKNVSIF